MSATLEPSNTLPAPLDRLAQVLIDAGQCDARAVERARRVAGETGQRFDAALLQLGLVSERGMATAYAALLGLELAEAGRYPADRPLCTDALSARFLRHVRAVPVAIEDNLLVVAIADPLDEFVPAAIEAATGLEVDLLVAIPVELDAALKRLYPADAADAGPSDAPAEPLADDTERLKDLASEAPVIRLVNQLLSRAVETQASDIHIEPFDDSLRIRYRYDGMLHEIDAPPPGLAAAITSRIKIMARLDIAERRMPQDGRIKFPVRGQDVDFRVSTVPSLHGETVVLRILDRSSVVLDYERLGLSDRLTARFRTALEAPNGLVLVTGPTGSGKTTTLYTGLLGLNAVVRKIVTIEDPIEFQLHGINQIQVHGQIGLSFAALLRSILRQDPDVIMLGEIRDGETAQIAVQSALTGHLVLSTLHTNSAAAAIPRLRDMGVEDYLLTAVLRGVLAQRLVRRLCTECRRPVAAPAELVRKHGLDRRCDGPVTLYRANGCPACRQTGYRGRMAIAEFLELDPEIVDLTLARADTARIERAAVAGGMELMFDAGLAAALRGDTTIEDVMRSIRADG